MTDDIFELAHRDPIVETVGCYIKLRNKNGKFYGLCPFHNDETVGSFVIFPDVSSSKRGWFQCYACGEKGDNIDFIRHYLHVGYREAAIIIAENAGLISRSDADSLRKRSGVPLNITPVRKEIPKEKILLAKKRSPECLDRVYRCFAAASNLLPDQMKDVLLFSRRVPENSLGKYFLFPDKSSLPAFWNRFTAELLKEFNITGTNALGNILIGIPGFYVGENKRVTFSASYKKRIGIMTYDRMGRISGIQIRTADSLDGVVHSKTEKGARYKFLSSGFANGTNGSCGTYGCSCGFVEDVLFPQEGWNRTIAITEGRFKAEVLASLGFLVVNMHSISNWKPAGQTAIELAGITGAHQFVVCYDSENNNNLFQSAANLYEQLSQSLLTEFAVWDPSFGKGIDDVINAGHIQEISRIPAQEYFNLHSVVA